MRPISCLLEIAPGSCPMVIFFRSIETTRSASRCPAESAKENRTFFSGSAAASALAALAKEPVPAEVSAAYQGQTFSFGQGYVIPKPFDPRLIEWLPPAVAQAAMDTGVARKPIEDMDAYKASLRVRIQKAQGRANALIESYK